MKDLSPTQPSRSSRGFTLIEMITAVGLLTLIVTGIYGIMNAGLTATTTMTDQQRRSQEFLGLQQLMRETFRSLPATVGLESRVEEGADEIQQLVLRDATGILDWGADELLEADVVLTTRKQPGGLRTLAIYHLDPEKNLSDEFNLDEAVRRLDLVEDLRGVTFRFYYAQGDRWFESWRGGGPRPDLIEFNVHLSEEEEPRRYVFWLPQLVDPNTLNLVDRFTEDGGDDDDDDDDDGNTDGSNDAGTRQLTVPRPQ
jgi:prepilin-type N-terminal cleavage/methylation domain-containing protein